MSVLTYVLTAVLQGPVGPVVAPAAFLEWDYATPGIEDEFRVYCSSSPGVVPDGVSFIATIAATASPNPYTTQWPISGALGQQHCVVTAVDTDTSTESAPSNEVPFFVLPGATSLRVVVP